MRVGKRLLRTPAIQRLLGDLLAGYLTVVRRTSRLAVEPADFDARARALAPFIVAMWHGQHFMVPFARPAGMDFRVMISSHADAEINALAAKRLGLGLIRASGASSAREIARKRGAAGFREAMAAIGEGACVALTADVPKGPARVAGRGIVLLAKHSGRPIVPVAFATSRNVDIDSWDSASVSLPFSRAGLVLGDPIHVPADADDAAVEVYRETVREGLDRVTSRAYALAGARSKFDHA
ncbi:lysophospholipid acyltransferase family protein [Chthonobacter rhizosphaerae]|uniref:lysophospholipid acyltransferase family protein n=1 Tax=Chthonobacter rhizosphaerae TaxID=2735553 RepID=UPI0015EEFFC5|nr:lysophospholipid acyltransferase family protein [Chthonobacter rhizosphaerae]